jgi:OTU domain-containing protein 6
LEKELSEKHRKELEELRQRVAASESLNGVANRLENLVIEPVKEKGEEEKEADDDKPLTNGIAYQQLKVSKTQRKREKKSQKEKERLERIAQEEVGGDINRSRQIEEEKFKKLLSGRSLTILEVPSDGDCMYKAIEHQLRLFGIDSSVQSLRTKAATFMRKHPMDFLPFLVSDSTGDMMTDDEFANYCHSVESTKAWGGQIELQALSHVLQMPIEVIQVDTPPVLLGDDKGSADRRLLISYHRHAYQLGEHYNSLVKK